MDENILYVVIIVCALILSGVGFYAGALWARRQKEQSDLAIRHDATRRHEEKIKELQEAVRKTTLEKDDLNRHFTSLPDLVRSLSSNPNQEQIASGVVRYLKTALDPQEIGFFVFLPEENSFLLIESYGLPPQYKGQLKIPGTEGKIGLAVAKGVIMDWDDYRHESAFYQVKNSHPPLPTDLCAPIALEDKILGVINLTMQKKEFKDNARRTCAMAAHLAAIHLEHYHLVRAKEQESYTDGLTGLFNKRYFSDRLVKELNKSADYNTFLSLILFDIDHFKHYNDTNGHPAGDVVLRQVAQITKAITRRTDIVARYGGEEFVVLMVDCPKVKAFEHAKKIREAIEKTSFPNGEKQPQGRLTISGGVASYPGDAQTAQELIKCADEALYQAKAGGRNAMCLYQSVIIGRAEDTKIVKG